MAQAVVFLKDISFITFALLCFPWKSSTILKVFKDFLSKNSKNSRRTFAHITAKPIKLLTKAIKLKFTYATNTELETHVNPMRRDWMSSPASVLCLPVEPVVGVARVGERIITAEIVTGFGILQQEKSVKVSWAEFFINNDSVG